MKRITLLALLLCLVLTANAQTIPWVTKQYTTKDTTVVYHTAVDYRNLNVALSMDVTQPTNDPPRTCGRPLMILIHGGTFMYGSKADANMALLRQDFAKRGYVAASIDYRLGMIQTFNAYGCALAEIAGFPWGCANETDTLEWYRAMHRGVQDAHAAIRYFMNNDANYRVDPNNVFVAGESAGGFIALGVGYIDVASEQLPGTGARTTAPQPNAIYVGNCPGATTNMNLARPDLGSYLGTGNWPAQRAYTIRGVGDLYGGCLKNPFLLNANNAQIPALYVYHQIGDLIVAHNSYRVMGLLNYCLVSNGFCPTYMINVPWVHGGTTVKNWVNALAANGLPHPVMQVEIVTNYNDCLQQIIFNPSVNAHALDNPSLRSTNMATFFASKIVGCSSKTGEGLSTLPDHAVQVYPNPSEGAFKIELDPGNSLIRLEVYDLLGKRVLAESATGSSHTLALPESLSKGTYVLHLTTAQGNVIRRIVRD
jgi:hypothetical protein